jgi:disulfide bond formation protein DsbB
MSIDTVTTFLALLAFAVQISIVLAAILSTVAGKRTMLTANFGPLALWGAAAVAALAMIGSLYLSEVAHFTPCKLCWYQRIAMYSSAVILLIAAIKKDGSVLRFAMPLSVIGALISSYHLLIERFPNLESSTCDPNNPCSLIWIKKFGYLTIPGMALTGFVAILGLLLLHQRWERASIDSYAETQQTALREHNEIARQP